MSLIVPAAHEQALLDSLEATLDRAAWLRHFEAELKKIDGCLSLVKGRENVSVPGVTPGYWHVKRDNPETVPTFLPICGPKGEFLEPHSGVLEQLRRSDLQRPGALDELRRAQAKQIQDDEKRAFERKLERVEEMGMRMKAMDSPGVSMASTKWTKSRAGRRARKRS